MAVEIVRSLCGSIGLIAAVPLTTVLAAALTRRGTEADQSSAVERRPIGRASYGLRGRLLPEQDQLVFDTVLGLHAPRLSHAAVGVNSASLPPEELPASVSQAAVTLRQLAATAARRNGSRYQRALAASTAHLARLSWLTDESRAKLLVSGQFPGVRVYYPSALPVEVSRRAAAGIQGPRCSLHFG